MVTQTLSFEAFFRAEHPRLVALGLTLVGDREGARELAQEALTRAYRNWDSVGAYDVPGAWVRRVLINLATDRSRRAASERRAIELLPPVRTYEPPEPVDVAWRDAVRSLPDRQRAVVALHYLEDRSVDDIAATLGIAHGTVKATLATARTTLRRLLDEGNR